MRSHQFYRRVPIYRTGYRIYMKYNLYSLVNCKILCGRWSVYFKMMCSHLFGWGKCDNNSKWAWACANNDDDDTTHYTAQWAQSNTRHVNANGISLRMNTSKPQLHFTLSRVRLREVIPFINPINFWHLNTLTISSCPFFVHTLHMGKVSLWTEQLCTYMP